MAGYAMCQNRGRISHEKVARRSKYRNNSSFFFFSVISIRVLWGTLRKERWTKKSELVNHPCGWDDVSKVTQIPKNHSYSGRKKNVP